MLAVSTSGSARPPAEESRHVVPGQAGSADERFGLETGVWLAPIVAAEAIAACSLRIAWRFYRQGCIPTRTGWSG